MGRFGKRNSFSVRYLGNNSRPSRFGRRIIHSLPPPDRQAVAAGYKDAAHIKQDKDLGALRERDDFKALLAELEAGTENDEK